MLFNNHPVNDTAKFNFAVPGGYDGPATLEVFDVKGRKVETVDFSADGIEGSVELDVCSAGLSPGIYIGRIKTNEYSTPVKFIVER